MKDVLSRVVTAQSLITTVKNVVTIGVVQGTAAASPVWPSLPVDTVQPDGRGLFYIPLAYVRVPNGFTSGSAVATNDIATVAPCLSLSRVLGGNTASWVNAGTATTAQQGAWGSSGTPPQLYASSAATGIETRLIAINLITGSESHTNGGIVDASQDWRGRLTRYTATAGTNASQFAWANPGVNITPIYTKAGVTGFGHTFITGTVGAAAYVDYNSFTQMTNGTSVRIFADNTTGALKVDWSGGAPNCLLIFAIDFFAPMR
ncbi:hypothetical protein AKJ09_11230 [Labilithrix luteola]|uniref:Uncharacterized protein n=2 Tax=Labilithrix luteola TaxID=1391654 RepID=A0A0K1QFY0_9BACT|nr:hypothetical protein AKJ09_11230 [Labilithrix luteola]